MGVLAETVVRVRPDVSRLGAEAKPAIDKFGDETSKQLEGHGRRWGQRTATGFGTGFSSIRTGAVAGFVASVTGNLFSMAAAGVKAGLGTAAGLEQAQIAFATLMHNSEGAKRFLKDLSNFAAATPFNLPGLVDDARLLMGVGVAANDVIPSLTAWGDAAGALGIQQEGFHRAMIAVSQSMSAGRINAQDMNQIVEAGIPVWKLMSEATGKTVPELRKLSEQGKLLSADILPRLQAQMEKDYGGSMAKQSQTLSGLWSTMTDTINIGLGTALQHLEPVLSHLIPAATSLAAGAFTGLSSGMDAFMAGVHLSSDRFSGFNERIREVGVGLNELVTNFRTGGPVIEGGFLGVMQRLGTIMHNAWQETRLLADAFVAGFSGDKVANVSNLRDVVQAFGEAVRGAINFVRNDALPALGAFAGWVGGHQQLVLSLVGAYVVWRAAVAAYGIAQSVAAAWTAVHNVAIIEHNIVMGISNGIQALANSYLGTWIGVKAIELVAWARSAAATIAHTAALGAHLVVLGAVRVATLVWTGVQWALNAAMSANPIGLVIIAIAALVAGVIYAWTHFAWFRTVVIDVWHALEAAFHGILVAWNWVKDGVVAGYQWLHDKAFVPLQWLITQVIPAAFRDGVDAIKAAWQKVQDAAKVPINFVIGFVNAGIIHPFNDLAKLFGVKERAPDIAKLASGGRVRGPGGPRDDRVPLWGSNGEFMVNARDTAVALPILEWINNGGLRSGRPIRGVRPSMRYPGDLSQGVPGFADGGLIGWLSSVGKGIWDAITDPAKVIGDLAGKLLSGIPGGPMLVNVISGMGHKLIDGIVSWVKGQGGAGNAGGAMAFLRSQVGQPYLWAGTGNGGWDCSAIIGAIWALLHGKNPRQRYFTTENEAGFFPLPGMGGVLSAGWTNRGESGPGGGPNGVGHTAGVLAGLPFESAGGVGVRIGAGVTDIHRFAHIGHFDRGGTVGGRAGEPALVVAHGGENIHPPGPVELADSTIRKLGETIGREINGTGRTLLRTARAS